MMGCYVHEIPGRLRVKIPLVKGRPGTAQEIEKLLRAIEGIDSTATNTTTGSVVINCNSKTLTSDKILSALNRSGWFERTKGEELACHLTLVKGERSKVEELAARLL